MYKYFVSFLVLIACILPARAEAPMQVGVFDDGAKLIWQCEPPMRGKVIIGFISPKGERYQAVVDCLPPAKNPQDI